MNALVVVVEADDPRMLLLQDAVRAVAMAVVLRVLIVQLELYGSVLLGVLRRALLDEKARQRWAAAPSSSSEKNASRFR